MTEIAISCLASVGAVDYANMNIQRRISMSEIVAATGLSRATVDRVLNKRPGVHPRTHAHVLRLLARLESDGQPRREETFAFKRRGAHRFGIVIQAGETFTRSAQNKAAAFPFRIERLTRARPPEKTSLLMDDSKVVRRR